MRSVPCALCALFVAAATPAAAQRFAPEPVDFDAEAEQHSDFWEAAIAGDRRRYDAAVERGVTLLEAGDTESLRRARQQLAEATELDPDRPLAHYWLGKTLEASGDWAACAASLGRAFRLEPGWVPPSGRAPPDWLLDFELALCLARAGDFEGAIAHHRRVLAGGHGGVSAVHWRLGEAYMALGRLGEAIDALRAAERLSSSTDVRFSLAVALDRDEQIAEARRTAELARARDPRLGSLLSARRVFTPAEDEHYYLGLARVAGGEDAHALFHFRRYLSIAGDSPWAPRARAHLDALADVALGDDLELRGSAAVEHERAVRALRAAAGRFEDCVAGQPEVLLQVVITALAPGAGASRVRPGVRVLVLDQGPLVTEELREVVACTEAAAAQVDLPRPRGPAGTYATAQFTLIAR